MGVLFENSVVENYNNSFLSILTEISQNEREVFSENLEIVNESFEDIKNKVVNFIKSIWNKIKGLYELFKRKILSYFKNNKIDKSKKEEFKNIVNKNNDKSINDNERKEINFTFRYPKKDIGSNLLMNDIHIYSILSAKENDLPKFKEDISNGEFLSQMLKSIVPNTSLSSFHDDLMNKLFYDEEEFHEMDSDIIEEVQNMLSSENIMEIINKIESENKKIFDELIIKYAPKENYKQKVFSDGIKILAKAVTIVNNEYIKIINFHLNQCRRVFQQVLSKHNEN